MDNNIKDFQINITEDEQREIVHLNADYQETLIEMGELHLNKVTINQELEKLKETEEHVNSKYETLKKKEEMFLERLSNKYGEGMLDPKTGIYIKS